MVQHPRNLREPFPEDMRNLAKRMPLEEGVRPCIVLAALEEYPTHCAPPRLGFDRRDHPRAGTARTQRRVDREVRQHREPHPRSLDPFDDRRGDDRSAGTAHQQQACARIGIGQVFGEARVEVVRPACAVGAQPALDLAMADVARIQAYDAGEEGSRLSAVGGGIRPDRIARIAFAPGHGAGASAHSITFCGQVSISVHCMCWPTQA